MRLTYQIAIPGVITVVCLLALCGLTFYSYQQYESLVEKSSLQMDQANQFISELSELRSQQFQDLILYSLEKKPELLTRLKQADEQVLSVWHQLAPLLPESPEKEQVTQSVLAARHRLQKAQWELAQSIGAGKNTKDQFHSLFAAAIAGRDAQRMLRNYSMAFKNQMVSIARYTLLRSAILYGVLLSMSVLTILLSLAFFQAHAITPLRHLTRRMELVGQGHYEKIEPVLGHDEIADVTRSFNGMVEQLQSATARLQESKRRLESFTSIAAHDLRSPIATIRDLAQYLLDANEGDTKDVLDRIVKIADRALHLMDKLLSLSRAGQKCLQWEKIDLDELFREVLAGLHSQISTTGGIIELPSNLPTLEGDPIQLGELFQNLISNALKYHKPQVLPRITITSSVFKTDAQEWLRICVKDNGIGFDEKEADQLFNPFHRAQGSHQYEGSGVGLAICKEIVTRHGGRIKAESKPNQGAIFEVDLPLVALREPELPA